jgi:hypothetical protein
MDLLEFLIIVLRLILAGFLVWGGLLCAAGLGWIKVPPPDAADRESVPQGNESKSGHGLLKAS